MNLLRNITIYLLIFNIIGSALTIPLIHLDFEMRKDYIAEILCINREKPITMCNGQCYLNKQLKKATEQKSKETKTLSKSTEFSFYNQEVKGVCFKSSPSQTQTDFKKFETNHFRSRALESLFKPPRFS